MQAARLATRLQREIRMLQTDPPPGVCAWPCNDSLSHLEARAESRVVYLDSKCPVDRILLTKHSRLLWSESSLMIQGPDQTVYEKGIFKVEVRVPERYPFEPPNVRFKTPIYHPNIDSGGRICLDILNMPPKGAWKPSLNIPTVLASVGLLMAEPNPDDGLMGDITAEYKHDRAAFDARAKGWTEQYAVENQSADESHEPHVSRRPNSAEHGMSASKTGFRVANAELCVQGQPIETGAKNAHHFSFGLGFDEESVEDVSKVVSISGGKELSASQRENIRGPPSGNMKLNLGRKLTLGKGASTVERDDTVATSATATPSDGQPFRNADAPRSASSGQKSTFEMTECTKSSGASGSASNASLRIGAEVDTKLTGNSLCSEPSAVGPATKASFAFEDRRVISKQAFLSSSNTSRDNNGSGVSETNNLARGAGDRLSAPVHSTTTACSSDSHHRTAQTSTPDHLSSDPPRTTAKHVEAVTGPPRRGAPPMVNHISTNSVNPPGDVLLNEGSARKAVHSPSIEVTKGFSGNGRTNTTGAECIEALDKQVQFMDCHRGEAAKSCDPKRKTARSGAETRTNEKAEALRDRSHNTSGSAEEKAKAPKEGSRNTSASSVSAGILRQTTVNTFHGIEANASPVRETVNLAALQKGNSSSIISKYFIQENAKGVTGPTQPQVLSKGNGDQMGLTTTASQVDLAASIDLDRERSVGVSVKAQAEALSTGAGNRTESIKQTSQIDPAALIVLDSESDEEPPKARSRLSLALRKSIKRKP